MSFELGIDSKYFNLHITIDNIDNGHAYKAIKVIEKIFIINIEIKNSS
jgi:hypothetical protein